MEKRPLAVLIRAKKLGVLIMNARQVSGKSQEECAAAIGVSPETFAAYELAEQSPSLPELETLAYFLKLPLDHFWGRETISTKQKEPESIPAKRLISLRNKMIGASLRQMRLQSGMTSADLTNLTGIPTDLIEAYELGEKPIPLPELENLASALGRTIKDFHDSRGPIGTWIKQQRIMQQVAELSPELVDFISKPVNRPYLELAKRLSEMSVEKLRAVAEGLLEITL